MKFKQAYVIYLTGADGNVKHSGIIMSVSEQTGTYAVQWTDGYRPIFGKYGIHTKEYIENNYIGFPLPGTE